MNPIYKKLFDTYGDTTLQEYDNYDEDEINEHLDKLPLGKDTRLNLDNLFFDYYYRWSTDAFILGLHLGLSLLDGQIRCPRLQESDQIPR